MITSDGLLMRAHRWARSSPDNGGVVFTYRTVPWGPSWPASAAKYANSIQANTVRHRFWCRPCRSWPALH